MPGGRKALVVATYAYTDGGLKRLAAPQRDAESFATVLEDPAIAGFDVTMLVNQPHYVVGEAIADFYAGSRSDDLTVLYFTGHGLKDDEGRLYLAMTNTRREALMFTAISGAQLNDAMDASRSRRKVLILDCCYSGAFPAGRSAKADEGVQTLERFQGKGRVVLTASDATQYAFEGDDLKGSGTSSVFTRYLVEAISSGAADLDEDGDIALDELYSYVYERVTTEMPQQRPKKQEDVDGRILIARNVHWTLPAYLRHAIESPIAAQRLSSIPELERLHQAGNEIVRAAVVEQLAALATDDSRSVSTAATGLLQRIRPDGVAASAGAPATASPAAGPSPRPPVAMAPTRPAREPALESPAPDAEQPLVPFPVEAPAPAPEGEPIPAFASAGDEPRAPPPTGREAPAPHAEPSAAAATGPVGVSVPVLLALIAVAGALLLLSRFLIFESTYASRVTDIGIPWQTWLIGAGLPLLVAGQMLILRGTEAWTLAFAGGLVAGAALSQLDLVLASGGYSADPDTDETPGPGWWVQLAGTVVLIACVVVLLRSPVLRDRPGLRRDWRAVVAAVLVIAALVAWLEVYGDYWVWFAQNEPVLLLAAVCLPMALLGLSPAQRLFGLVAVSVFGLWVACGPVRQLITDSLPLDARAAVVSLVSVLCSVAACWLAQARPPRRPSRPVGEPVASR
jgi:hypothetical protein